jgi:phage baseplate assembly protein V
MFPSTPIELQRQIQGLIRIAVITEVNAEGQVKVKQGELESPWLRCLHLRSAETISWQPLDVDEQVLLLCPNGVLEQALVLGTLYQEQFPAPSDNLNQQQLQFQDGSSILYDREAHLYQIHIAQDEAQLNLLSDDQIGLKAKKNMRLEVEEEKLQLQAKQGLSLQSVDAEIALTAKTDVEVGAEGQVSLAAQGEMVLECEKNFSQSTQADSILAAQGSIKIESQQSIELVVGSTTLKLSSSGLEISASQVTLKADLGLNLQAANLSAKSDAMMSLETSGIMTIKGAMVKIN